MTRRSGCFWVVAAVLVFVALYSAFQLGVGSLAPSPAPTYRIRPSPTLSREQLLLGVIRNLNDPQFVGTRYRDSIGVSITGGTLTFAFYDDADSLDELQQLAEEMMLFGVRAADMEGWRFSRIEFFQPGPLNSSVTFYLEGQALESVRRDPASLWDVVQTTVDWGDATPQPSADGEVCNCSGNLYQCADFENHAQAQACYEYCLGKVGRDVHLMDTDKDGIACEALP